MQCRIESGAEASTSNSHSTAAIAATHAQMYAPYEKLGRNNNQTSCICGRTDVSDITVQCEVKFLCPRVLYHTLPGLAGVLMQLTDIFTV